MARSPDPLCPGTHMLGGHVAGPERLVFCIECRQTLLTADGWVPPHTPDGRLGGPGRGRPPEASPPPTPVRGHVWPEAGPLPEEAAMAKKAVKKVQMAAAKAVKTVQKAKKAEARAVKKAAKKAEQTTKKVEKRRRTIEKLVARLAVLDTRIKQSKAKAARREAKREGLAQRLAALRSA